MRDSFIFYESFYTALSRLDDASYRRLVDMICEYVFNDIEPSGDGIELVAFDLIKPQIDANNKRYEDGRKGGRPKKTSGFDTKNQWLSDEKPVVSELKTSGFEVKNQWLSDAKPNVNVNGNGNDTDNVNGNADGNVDGNGNGDVSPTDRQTVRPSDTPSDSFTPPTIEQVRMYILERGSDVLAERFFDYYSERNWTTAKGEPMKDWRAAVRYWEKTENQKPKSKTTFGETRTDSLDGFVRAVNARR